MLLLTATPIQLKIRELFDLLNLLGLGGKWAKFHHFQRYYLQLFLSPDEKDWNFLIDMARDSINQGRVEVEQYRSYLEDVDLSYADTIIRILIEGDKLSFYSDIFSTEFWEELSKALEGLTPLSWYMFRFTRTQLTKYGIPTAERKPKDIPVTMIKEETELYNSVEEYIKDIYKNLDETKRIIVGFTLAIYRRRLTSSFQAILKSLKRRLDALLQWKEGKGKGRIFEDDDIDDEISDAIDENTGTYILTEDYKSVSDDKLSIPLARESLEEEIEYLSKFIKEIEEFLSIHDESKLKELYSILKKANEEDAKRILIFTQYTDTLDFLKSKLIENPEYRIIGCFSGRGGELCTKSNIDGELIWREIPKETIKDWFFEETESFKIMLCTDAASEGLNFHICYWLINYDLPWNPMKVEQRIGRIDRVKQESEYVKIRNLLYNETIEGDIYFRLIQRIGLFKTVIGPLQPILQEFFSDIERKALFERDQQSFRIDVDELLDRLNSESQRAIEQHDFYIRLINFRIDWIEDFQYASKYSFMASSFEPFFIDITSRDSSIQLIERQNDNAKCRIKSMAQLLPSHENKYLKCTKNRSFQNSQKSEIALTRNEAERNLDARWFNYGDSIFSCYLNKWANKASNSLCISIFKNDSSLQPKIVLLLQYESVSDMQIYKFLKITYEIPSWGIINIETIDYMKELGTYCDNLKEKYSDNKKTLTDFLKKNNITADLLNTHIVNLTNQEIINFCSFEPSKFSRLISSEARKLKNWLATQQLILKDQLKNILTQWLLMEYLYLKKDEDWDTLEENIPLGNYFEEIIRRQGPTLEFDQELFDNVIDNLEIFFDEITLTKEDEIFRDLKESYKSENKRKLLRANQRLLRQQIAKLLEEWSKITTFYRNQTKKVQQRLNRKLQLTISGIIFYL